MINLLYATDAHLKSKNPSRRKDNYQQEILDILSELGEIAKKNKAKAILFGGDLFDAPKISQRLYNKVANIISKYPCKLYAIAGNHDIFGMNTDTLSDTMLGGLASSGLITLLDKDSSPHFILDFKSDLSIALYGHPYHSELDKGDIYSDYYLDNKDLLSNYNLLMTHSMLLEKPFHPDVHYSLINDVAKITNADIIFGAHYHPGWQVIKQNNTTFIHPGAIARLEATKEEITRQPSYALLSFTKDTFTVKIIPFASAKPGPEVLDINSLTIQKENYDKIQSFRETISTIDSVYLNNVQDTLISISNSSQINSHIKDLAIEKISNIESSIEKDLSLAGFIEDVTPKKIKSVIIENFQSHVNTTINFGDGLNAIIGPSDSGKTSIIRAIRWCLYNDPKGTDFINRNFSDCTVSIIFTDGVCISRTRSSTSSGSYTVSKNQKEDKIYKGFSNNIPIDIYNAHQMPKIYLNKDIHTSLNISSQLEPPFLMTESPYTKSSVIGKLTGVHILDTAIKDSAKDLYNNQKEHKSLIKKLSELEERLDNEFNDVPYLESLTKKLEKILDNITNTHLFLDNLYSIKSDYISLSDNLLKLESSYKEVNLFILENQELIESISNKFSLYNSALRIKEDFNLLDNTIINIDSQLDSINNIDEQLYNKLINDFNLYTELLSIRSDIETNATSIEKLSNNIATINTDLELNKEEYNHLLSSFDYCPTCNSKINK